VRSEADPAGLRVVVDADGAVQFKDFTLADPWRVVVDISGVRSVVGNKTLPVAAAGVERVRVGQSAPHTVRIVVDAKSKLPYRVLQEGAQLVILLGGASASGMPSAQEEFKPEAKPISPGPSTGLTAQAAKLAPASTAPLPASNSQSSKPAAQSTQQATQKGTPPKSPAAVTNAVKETITQQTQSPSATRSAEQQRSSSQPIVASPVKPAPSVAVPAQNQPAKPKHPGLALCDESYVGGLISFDLRAGVDLRDMLRFISQQYGVNFIIDKSVGPVPVDIRVNDIPWNEVMNSVLRANRLGAICEGDGRIIRIATLQAVKEQRDQQRWAEEARLLSVPVETKIIRLKYARVSGSLGGTGTGRSGVGNIMGTFGYNSPGWGSTGANKYSGGGGLLDIIKRRLSPRGTIEIDQRTNSLIVTDIAEYLEAAQNIVAQLDRPDPQVEIEARIVIASRNFLRDIGVELAAAAANLDKGTAGILETSPVRFSPSSGLTPGGKSGGGSGSGGSGGDGGGTSNQQIGPNLIGPFADTALRNGVASTVLSLTTGALGTGIISSALSASETKGQIRTIASPRITASNNQTAEIVNGVQIPVQTVSNNTITTTFVTAALRLEITPQIIEETGEVLMHVVAENNTVNFALANQFNNGTPGINTQSADSTVRMQDGGTTVMGGINIDTEGHTVNRTPGISRLPVIGELFKRRTTRRDFDEILFFITPRIVRPDGSLGPRSLAPQRSSVEGTPILRPISPVNAAGAPAKTSKPAQGGQKAGQ
jgi:type IV pilus assembly protein PilQ